jgi:hypothetical protein
MERYLVSVVCLRPTLEDDALEGSDIVTLKFNDVGSEVRP